MAIRVKTYTVLVTIEDDRPPLDAVELAERIQRELEEGRPPYGDGPTTRGVTVATVDTFDGLAIKDGPLNDRDSERLSRVRRLHIR